MQVLQEYWDKTFSEHSYGFRPGRSAHQAISRGQQYVEQGYRWIVDIDLEKFFDRVNHDKLMGNLAKRIHDKRLLKIIRAFLNAGVMENGLVSATRHKAARYRHCCRTWFLMSLTESWSEEVIDLCVMPTTVTSMSVANVQAGE